MTEEEMTKLLKKDVIRFTFDVNSLVGENAIIDKLKALNAPKQLASDLSEAIVHIYLFCKDIGE